MQFKSLEGVSLALAFALSATLPVSCGGPQQDRMPGQGAGGRVLVEGSGPGAIRLFSSGRVERRGRDLGTEVVTYVGVWHQEDQRLTLTYDTMITGVRVTGDGLKITTKEVSRRETQKAEVLIGADDRGYSTSRSDLQSAGSGVWRTWSMSSAGEALKPVGMR